MLYISIHKYCHGEYWPNLRLADADYIGSGPGKGFNINVPLNKVLKTRIVNYCNQLHADLNYENSFAQEGLGNEDYMAIFHHIIMPVAYEVCFPDFLILKKRFFFFILKFLKL